MRTLVLDSSLPETLAVLAPEQLPAVTKLAIVRFREPGLIDGIVEWLPRLRELELRTSKATSSASRAASRVTSSRGSSMLAGSRAIAASDAIEHTGKPEWGRGTIVREYDGKLEIAFEHGGTRTLKADAPFLRRVR